MSESIDRNAAIAAIRRLEIDGSQMIWSSDAIDAVKGVEPDAPHVPDVGKTINNLYKVRAWAIYGSVKLTFGEHIAKVIDDAITVIDSQRKTLDEIDRYVRELDKAVNGDGKSPDSPT